MYKRSNLHASKTIVIGVLTFWLIVVLLLMAAMSGLYYHYRLGQAMDKYVWEHRCIQIDNTDLWRCDDGIIEL